MAADNRLTWPPYLSGNNLDDVRGYPAKGGFLTDVGDAVPGEGEYEFREKPKACGWWNGYSALCLRALEEGVLFEFACCHKEKVDTATCGDGFAIW